MLTLPITESIIVVFFFVIFIILIPVIFIILVVDVIIFIIVVFIFGKLALVKRLEQFALILTDYFISASTKFLAITVTRNTHNILRIDLNDNDLIASLNTSIRCHIVQCTSMKSLRASHRAVIVYLCSTHCADLTHPVVKLTFPLIPEVATDCFVCKEMSILSDRKIFMLQEIIQFSLTLHTWILHKIFQEIYERLKRQTLAHK